MTTTWAQDRKAAEDEAVALTMKLSGRRFSPAQRRKLEALIAPAMHNLQLAVETITQEPVGAFAHLVAARARIDRALEAARRVARAS